MKKVIAIAIVVLFVVALSSCKSHEKCAAYSKVDNQEVNG